MSKIVIPLNAYGQSEMMLDEFETCLQVIKESGAYGVELRRELFWPSLPLLEKLQQSLEKYKLFTVYSAPVFVWREDGALNQKELETVFNEAGQVKASWIKVSLGHYQEGLSDLNSLKALLNSQSIQLLVENDQTSFGGQIDPLKQFFDQVNIQKLNVKMTFDIGNWYYTGQDPMKAIEVFAAHVMYVHLKKVIFEDGTPITIPLSVDTYSDWKPYIDTLSTDILKALEFPINPIQKTKAYVDLVLEREEELV